MSVAPTISFADLEMLPAEYRLQRARSCLNSPPTLWGNIEFISHDYTTMSISKQQAVILLQITLQTNLSTQMHCVYLRKLYNNSLACCALRISPHFEKEMHISPLFTKELGICLSRIGTYFKKKVINFHPFKNKKSLRHFNTFLKERTHFTCPQVNMNFSIH